MGTLASSLFQIMLGWIRSVSSEIWNAASNPGNGTLFGWIGDNWKMIALVLCAVGLAADLTVYLFRWQPYRVWRSFFHRLRHREEAEEESEPETTENGSMPDRRTEEERLSPEQPDRREAARRYFPTAETPEPYRYAEEAAAAPEPVHPEERPGVTWQKNEPEGTTASFEQAILPRRRRSVKRLFSDSGEEEYASPDQLIDRYEAYRRPVYPRSWKTDGDDRENET